MPTLLQDFNFDAMLYLFKGEWGTRKSTSALSFPLPQLWLSWDRKSAAMAIPARNWKIDLSKTEVMNCDDWNKPKAKLESLTLDCPFKTIIVDSITSMADMTLRQVLRTKGNEGVKGNTIGGVKVNTIEDFNAEASAITELIGLSKDLIEMRRLNVIFIAHVMEVTKPVGQKEAISRSIVTAAKRVAAKLPAYCDEVYHFDISSEVVEGEGGDYTVITEHTGHDFARTSLELPRKIKLGGDPLYSKYIEPAINKLKTAHNQPVK